MHTYYVYDPFKYRMPESGGYYFDPRPRLTIRLRPGHPARFILDV